eukprot:TRINITY_DN100105_c0_g1_i1.p2 TRINITY_DN100105_c0_g1~~TRINITY_DN100105_c0_g1_i1.p2  ORF type:complete len:109 (+),score=23.37 TRINITY_DN100105_c0_g1_i1:81-407(+)
MCVYACMHLCTCMRVCMFIPAFMCVQVGYAMSMKADTAVLHTLVETMEKSHPTDNHRWVTDLVLGLLLQGANPASMLPEDEATTWYHIVLFLCCITGRVTTSSCSCHR